MKRERSRRSPSPDKPTPRPHKEEISKVRYYIKHDGKYVKSIGISTSYQGIGGLRYTTGYSNKENGMYAYSLELAESISKSIGGYYEREGYEGLPEDEREWEGM